MFALLFMAGCGLFCPEGSVSVDGECEECPTGSVVEDGVCVPGFVEVPAGTFEMGQTEGQPDYGFGWGSHTVTLTRAYLVGATEVTQAQFKQVMSYNPAFFVDDEAPVEQVDWNEAAAYAAAVSRDDGLEVCYDCVGEGADAECSVAVDPYECGGYRLLTEAEWENAARCGTDLVFAGSDVASDVGWTGGNDGGGGNSEGTTHDVAGLQPNGCGIYDMTGNVIEWVNDRYDDAETDPVTDPAGPAEVPEGRDEARNVRGGGWQPNGKVAVSYRNAEVPGFSDYALGFRMGRLAD